MSVENLAGKSAEEVRIGKQIKIQKWVFEHIDQTYDTTRNIAARLNDARPLSAKEKNELIKSLEPRHESKEEGYRRYFDYLCTANFARPFKPMNLVDELLNLDSHFSATTFLEDKDISDVIRLVSPFFLKDFSFDTSEILNLYKIPSQNKLSGKEFKNSGMLDAFIKSDVRLKILEIVLSRLPAVHCMNNNKPLKVVNNGKVGFTEISEKYNLTIPCLADYETRDEPEFSQGVRTSVHLAPLPVPGHEYGGWGEPDKIVVSNMLEIYQLNIGNAELVSLNGVDMQFIVGPKGLILPNSSKLFLLSNKASLTKRQEALATRLGVNVEHSQEGREACYRKAVGDKKADVIERNIYSSKWGFKESFGDALYMILGISTGPHDGSQHENFDKILSNIAANNGNYTFYSRDLVTILEASPIQLDWLNKVIDTLPRRK